MAKKFNKKLLKKKNNKNMRMNDYFRPIGNTNKLYRNSIPRTLQIATRRNMKQTLKFVSNQTYQVNPGGDVGGMQNTYLRIRANSIYDIMQENGTSQPPNTFIPQDPQLYGPAVTTINAEGFEDWNTRYYHFTVLGSRIQATFEPTGIPPAAATDPGNTLTPVPSTFYINLSGASTLLATGSNMSVINKLPYTKRASIIPQKSTITASSNNGYAGVRLHMNYSTKKFEGVTDVDDNDQFKGNFVTPSLPGEGSYFTVGLRNTIPSGSATECMPAGILRLKVEYIVKLTEPTNTNKVQENAGGIFG